MIFNKIWGKNEKSAGNPWWFHEKIVTLQPFNQKDKKEYIE